MSSHRRRTKYFSRDFNARKALIRGLIGSIVEHGRITTTVDRAKEVRRHVEKAITVGKRGDIATYRLLLSRIPHKPTIDSIMKDLSVRFMDRPGGYTRVIKIGRRPGDTAEMAFLEFVDYDFEAKGPGDGKKGDVKKTAAEAKLDTKEKKSLSRLVAAKKKSGRKIQRKARVASRS